MIKLYVLLQIATIIAVYADWSFAKVKGIGWGWAGVIWLYSIVFYFPLDLMKFAIRYILSGKAWQNLLENKVCICSCVSFLSIMVKAFMTIDLNWLFQNLPDCLHHQERLRQGGEGSSVGSCSEDPAWTSTTRNF